MSAVVPQVAPPRVVRLAPEVAQLTQVLVPGAHAPQRGTAVGPVPKVHDVQPVPVVKKYPVVQVRPVATVAAVHVAAPAAQAVQAPEATKYPELQTTHPVAVALTQAAQFEEAKQAVQVPGATIKNPEVQDAQAVTLGVVQTEQYAQPGTFVQVVPDVPVVP